MIHHIEWRKAMTLIEMVIALAIISFIAILITKIPYETIEKTTTERLFFSELDAMIRYSQEISILHQVRVYIYFDAVSETILFHSQSADLSNHQMVLPDHWDIPSNATIIYAPNGHVTHYQRISLLESNGSGRVNLNFQLGSGRYTLDYSR